VAASQLMQRFAKSLHLAGHQVQDKELFAAGDVEGHRFVFLVADSTSVYPAVGFTF
jgi:hypothetical protein